VLIILCLLLPIGCHRTDSAPVAEPRIVVCATVYPLADVVREVGGEHVRVDWIIDLGDPLAGFTTTEAERHRLTGVDLLVCDGPQTEGWAQQAIASLSNSDKVVSLDHMRISHTTPSAGARWLDPLVVKEFAVEVARRMGLRMPQHADEFRARAAALGTKLDQLTQSAQIGKERVLVTDTLLDPLLDRFGVASVEVDIDPLDLNDADIKKLRTTAEREHIRNLLLPFDTPPGLITDLEARTNLRVFLIDELGLPQFPGHAKYLEIGAYNVAQLRDASAPRN